VKGLEKRAEGEGLPDIVGYAAIFNVRTELWSGTTEEIAPGAFTRSLEEKADVRALRNHDPDKMLGRTKAGTLALNEDGQGLRARISPPDTTLGRETVELIRRGDLNQMSFAFRIVREEAEYDDDGANYRLMDVDLVDISVVTFPQYEDTTAEVDDARSIVTLEELRERVDTKLRDARSVELEADTLRRKARIRDLSAVRAADDKRASGYALDNCDGIG
jgi:HK97 family phage prohead protease